MNLITKQEYADRIGKPTNYLSVVIDRGNVICDKNGYIDIDHPKNKAYLAKKISKNPELQAKSQQIPRSETYVPPNYDDENTDEDPNLLSLPQAEQKKKHYEAIIAEKMSQIRDLDVQKKSGAAIPTVYVSPLLSEALRTFALGYRDLYEREIQKIALLAGFTTKEIADLRKNGIDNINVTYENCMKQVKDKLKHIISENSVKKGVGEREI